MDQKVNMLRACRSFQSWENFSAERTKTFTGDASYLHHVSIYFSRFLNARNCWRLPPTIRFWFFVPVSLFMLSALNTPHSERADGPGFHSLVSSWKSPSRKLSPSWSVREFCSLHFASVIRINAISHRKNLKSNAGRVAELSLTDHAN